MTAFVIWMALGILIAALGVYCFFAKKQVGFWANAKTPEMRDVRAYNRAVGKLWLVYAAVFCVLGLPLLREQPSALTALSVVGVMLEIVVLIVVYMKIEQKYKK